MTLKKLLLLSFLALFVNSLAQAQDADSALSKLDQRKHKLMFGAGLNIPLEPNSRTHDLGMSVSQQYEYLLWSHFSLMQSLSFNFITGQKINENYHGQEIVTQYNNFYVVPLQVGIVWYFGENHKKFFIAFAGGAAWYQGVEPAYPEIVVNGITVRPAIPEQEFSGVFNFFTPSIGWQWERLQLRTTYQGTINTDTQLNVWNISLAYRVF